jgi:thiamine-phosphate pyrophosphorylase
MHQMSPGVERALVAAEAWSVRLGAPAVRVVDHMLGLLDEEEGRPAVLLERYGLDVAEVRERLAVLPEAGPSVPSEQLLDAARGWSLGNRADPTILTDSLLLAVLEAAPAFWDAVPLFNGLLRLLRMHFAREEGPMAEANDPVVSFDVATGANEAPDLAAARVLDANLNRGREALRVVEDYCRFVLDDRFLTEQVKEARHLLAKTASQLPANLLLAGRETLRDVGAAVTAGNEYQRGSPREVAAVNLKRLQESLRSLEEFGKLYGPEIGRELELIRYRTYTLERAVILGTASRERLKEIQLYVLLTASRSAGPLERIIQQAAAGGATMFQLREKELADRELIDRARQVRRWTHETRTLFIMNDRPDIAKLVDADGVHLGQDDLPVREARRIVGPDALVGVSTHSIEQVRHAILDGADYLGIGPVFPSKTKAFESFPGLDFVKEASRETTLACFALGGIAPENIGAVAAAGGCRVAVGSGIASAGDPQAAARIIRAALNA